MLRILVDSDACPVKDIIWTEALHYGIPVIWVVSLAHITDFPGPAEVVRVDSGPEAVDLALINRAKPGDLVVTQDYGLADMALNRRALAISPRGRIYRRADMDRLLTERYIGAKIRRAGGRTRGPAKMTEGDRQCFRKSFTALLSKQAEDGTES